ncbi:MAG: hypothetical protein ISS19_14615 [Bacteroidales bacterium]|nr:hypothetical protein [Bacteroidales bacterium]
MRKIIHTIFAVILLVSTTGMTINLHYCHEQLIDASLYKSAKHCCDIGENDKPCHHGTTLDKPFHCKDESIIVKLADNFLVSSDYFESDTDYNKFLINYNLTPLSNWMFLNNNPANTVCKFSLYPPPQRSVLSKSQSFLI